MRYLSLILLMFLVVGCTEPDPWRAAIAQERSVIAHNAQAQTAAQISVAQSAEADRRNAQTRLEALQAQQALVASQAVIAQADAQTAIVASNHEALVMVADRIVEATRPDYRPLYAGMASIVVVVVVWLVVNGCRPVVVAPELPQAPQPPRVIYQSNRACAWLRPDGKIILRRLSDGSERVYLPTDEFYSRLLAGG